MIWRNKELGFEYRLKTVAQFIGQGPLFEGYPEMVVFESLVTGQTYVLPKIRFHETFEEVSDARRVV